MIGLNVSGMQWYTELMCIGTMTGMVNDDKLGWQWN
jgi:hypothetical protein